MTEDKSVDEITPSTRKHQPKAKLRPYAGFGARPVESEQHTDADGGDDDESDGMPTKQLERAP